MPVGGFNVGTWDEAVPASGEGVGLGDDRMRSIKTTLRQALDSEHVWASSGGTVGQHRYGSARAFYGPQSSVSASDTSVVADGRMMVTSDTSRLFAVGSGGTTLLGGWGVLSVDTTAGVTFPQRTRWVAEFGVVELTGGPDVTFPNSGFSGRPFLFVSIYTQPLGAPGVAGAASWGWKLGYVNKSGFSGEIVDTTNNVIRTDAGIMWLSIGTRAL